MSQFIRVLLYIGVFVQMSSLTAMVYDNRYLPLYGRTYSRTIDRPSFFMADLFIDVANNAALDGDESIGIPEILGKYDQNKLANAFVALGLPNPLIGTPFAQYIGRDIDWKMHGKIQSEGAAFAYRQRITDNVSIGASWFFMHLFSKIRFEFNQPALGLTDSEKVQLDALRRSMQQQLGFEAPQWNKSGMSDIDMYLRFGNTWNYTRKIRRVDAGIFIGAIFPSGVVRDVNNPASIPFGGNGRWGIYTALELEFEVREDWKVGLYGRMNKRLARTTTERLPLAGEQPLFGALLAPARTDPGETFVISPYIRVEDIRDGLGFEAQYTIVGHLEDLIEDARFGIRTPEPRLRTYNEHTGWSSEYLTVSVFYDFSRVRVEHSYAPIVSFNWDIPIQFFATSRVSKTNRVALGITFGF